MASKKQVLAFAASNSQHSINKQLVSYASALLTDVQVELIDLNDYELPIFSVEREIEIGQPELAKALFEKIGQCDGLIISFAEHNGNYSAAYKNLFDWMSRIDARVYQHKPMVLLATSPGGRGGQSVLNIALEQIPRFGGNIKGSLSLPKFDDYFDRASATVVDAEIQQKIETTVNRIFD